MDSRDANAEFRRQFERVSDLARQSAIGALAVGWLVAFGRNHPFYHDVHPLGPDPASIPRDLYPGMKLLFLSLVVDFSQHLFLLWGWGRRRGSEKKGGRLLDLADGLTAVKIGMVVVGFLMLLSPTVRFLSPPPRITPPVPTPTRRPDPSFVAPAPTLLGRPATPVPHS